MRIREHAWTILAASLAAVGTRSNPVTTVPWNGHAGAASFTFDDACQSQLDNVVPALEARNIHATFFLYDVGGAFSNNKAAWVEVAKAGNELANHSVDHADFSKSIDGAYQVSEMASRLREADGVVEAVTFAYPYCAVGYESAVNAENIIGRGCLFASPYQPLQWKDPPSNWNNVGAIYVSDDATAAGPTLAALDAAKNGGWIATLNHGVGGDWAAVSTANVLAMFDRAIADGLWVGTYQEVAAYWRAALTMDTAKAVAVDSGWMLSWASPHPRMPRSVPLRVRIDRSTFGNDAVAYQDGIVIEPENDGSLVIEFMKLGLEIRKRPADSFLVQASAKGVSPAASPRWSGGAILVPGVSNGWLRVADARGRVLLLPIASGRVVAPSLPPGIYHAALSGRSCGAFVVP